MTKMCTNMILHFHVGFIVSGMNMKTFTKIEQKPKALAVKTAAITYTKSCGVKGIVCR